MRRILVTGGAGFIGSNFVHRALAHNADVRLVNFDSLTYAGNLASLTAVEKDSRYRFVRGDIRDRALLDRVLAEEQIDVVVHFAAESHVDRSIVGPGDFIQTNVLGTFTLLEAVRALWLAPGNPCRDARFIHVSTDEVYGSLGKDGMFTEETGYDPRSPHAASRAASDHLVSAYFHTYGLPAIITNCSNNYGPYQFPEKLIPLVINNAQAAKSLPVYGEGKNVRDWLFVTDHCDALLTVLARGAPGETYNIGGNSEKENIRVVETICDLLDERLGLLPNGQARRSLITFVKDRPGHDRRYAIDAGKIRRELNWAPAVTFADGIRRTVDWYLDNRAWVAAVTSGAYRDYYRRMYDER